MQVCKRKCSEVQRCTPCKQPRCTFAAPDVGLEDRGVGVSGGEATSHSESGHCHLPLCPLPSSSASSSSASSSSSSSPTDGCGGAELSADLPHSSGSSPCCFHHPNDDCQARSADSDHLSINHLPSSILLKVRVQQRHTIILLDVLSLFIGLKSVKMRSDCLSILYIFRCSLTWQWRNAVCVPPWCVNTGGICAWTSSSGSKLTSVAFNKYAMDSLRLYSCYYYLSELYLY